MEKNQEIFTEKLLLGNRSYFFDLLKTSNGNKYIKISESKRINENKYEHHRIMVFEEDIEKFVNKFGELIKKYKEVN